MFISVKFCYNLYFLLRKYCRSLDNLVTHSIRKLFYAKSRVANKKDHVISYFSTKIYVAGTEKNHLNEHPKLMLKNDG